MRIAFDGRQAAGNRAGLGSYSRFVIRCMAQRYPDCRFDIYVEDGQNLSLLASLKGLPNVEICTPKGIFFRHFPFLWTLFCIPCELRRRNTDIYHGLANYIPRSVRRMKDVKKVVTIHDLIFISFPSTYNWLERHFNNIRCRRSCRIADKIISVSKCTAVDIVKYYFTPKEKIEVVYQGCDPAFRQGVSEGFKSIVRHRFSLPEHFILNVGTIEERKNAEVIVKALEYVPDMHLVIVGRKTRYIEKVIDTAKRCGVCSRVHILSGVGYRELPAIYRQADVFVFPSKYEGFGIPILEALCSGVPVVGATGSCLEEAGGDAAVYVDPDDTAALAGSINKILSDEALKESMIEKGYAHAERFSDDILAEKTMDVYGTLSGKEKCARHVIR